MAKKKAAIEFEPTEAELQALEVQRKKQEEQQAFVSQFTALLDEMRVAGCNIGVNSISGQGFTMRFDPKAINVQFVLVDV